MIRQKRLIGLALVLLAAVVVAASSRLHGLAEAAVQLVGAIVQQHPGWGVVAFVVFAALSAMLAFFSSVVVIPIAAHQWGEGTTVVLLWTGWLLGGVTAYAVGRFLGSRVARQLVSAGRVQYYEDRLSAQFLGRQYWMMLVVGVAGIGFLAWAIRRLHRELEAKP